LPRVSNTFAVDVVVVDVLVEMVVTMKASVTFVKLLLFS